MVDAERGFSLTERGPRWDGVLGKVLPATVAGRKFAAFLR
ncbi:hypothetical protein B4135_2407 [Caldibacillus debilis]|uniref:Uncharacterized protein n=1 Tax=Caldibacillus debilis TaxID=301148 RepID=A0A150M026_9BACI|nr:hypothetical protein B4135_2407 [Caldibacillus debilis]